VHGDAVATLKALAPQWRVGHATLRGAARQPP
jgi:hypothetical protein